MTETHGAGSCRGSRTLRTRISAAICVLLASVCLTLAFSSSASAEQTTAVNGVADQNLAHWDGGFAASPFALMFLNNWYINGHIRVARYAVQWNAFTRGGGYENELKHFSEWYENVRNWGFYPEVAFTNFPHCGGCAAPKKPNTTNEN
jgi:hypothetical protein